MVSIKYSLNSNKEAQEITRIALSLLHHPLEKTEFPFVVIHPFTSSSHIYNPKTETILDLTKEEDLYIWYVTLSQVFRVTNVEF